MPTAPQNSTSSIQEVLTHAGMGGAIAREVASHLVEADLKGHDSHGSSMTPLYLANLRAGRLKPDTQAKLSLDRGAAAPRRSSLASWDSAKWRDGRPRTQPWSGRRTTAWPASPCPTAAIRTASMPMARVAPPARAHPVRQRGAPCSAGGPRGRPTTNPAAMHEEPFGALDPCGPHKGYGPAVMCGLLGGALAGNWTAQPGNARDGNLVNSVLTSLFDPSACGDLTAFHNAVRQLAAYLRSAAPAPGFDRVRPPGEPSRKAPPIGVLGIPLHPTSMGLMAKRRCQWAWRIDAFLDGWRTAPLQRPPIAANRATP